VRLGDFRMKRMTLMAGMIGGAALLLAACGGSSGGGSERVVQAPPEVTVTPSPSATSECNLPPVPEHLARWAQMKSTWEPMIVVSESPVPLPRRPWPVYRAAGRLSEQDLRAIARALYCLDEGRKVAFLLGDHTVVEKAGIGAPGYVGDVVRRLTEEMKKNGQAEIYISHYRPSLVFLEEVPADHWNPDERGRLVATVSLCRRYTVHYVDWTTGEERRTEDYDEKWAAGIVRWDDGSWRISAFNDDVPSPCFYDQYRGDRVPVRP
jgi:hypothetical protein